MKHLISLFLILCLLLCGSASAEEIRTCDTIELTEEYAAKPLLRIFITKAEAETAPSVLIDLENGMACFGLYDFLDDPMQAEMYVVLDDALRAQAEALLADIHPWDWEPVYDFSDPDCMDTDWSYWEACLVYEDGVWRSVQYGMPEDDLLGKPYEASYLTKALMQFVWDNAQ